MIRFTGAAVGTTIGGIILYTAMPATFNGLTGPISGFREVYLLGAAVCLTGVLAGLWLWRRPAARSKQLANSKCRSHF